MSNSSKNYELEPLNLNKDTETTAFDKEKVEEESGKNINETENLDHILETYVGGIGIYQILITAILYHASWGGAWHVYTAYAPDHRCRVSSCESINQTKTSSNIYDHEWLEYAIPLEEHSQNFLDSKNEYDSCQKYDEMINFQSSCTPQHFNTSNIVKCEEYIYDNTFLDETLATKFDLVCDNQYYLSLLGTIVIIAILFGSLIGGRLGDQFGRIKIFFIAHFIMVASYIPMGYVQSYEAYAALYFIWIFSAIISGVNVSIYIAEIYTSKWRYVSYIVSAFPVAQLVTSLIMYLNRTYTGIHLWGGISSMVILLFYFLIPESPRWLAQNRKEKDALKVFIYMAKINRKYISDKDKSKIERIIMNIAKESHQTEDKLTFIDMFKHGNLFRTLNLFFAWTMACVSHYALSFSAADLSGNIILNYVLINLFGIPERILIAVGINKIGRKKTLVSSHTILGFLCIGLAFIPKEHSTIILIIYLLAFMCAGISFGLVYLVTIELYPTNMRSQSLGTCSAFARIFCACAPFLSPLAKYWQPLPMLIVGVPIILSGLLALKLPETYKEDLPQTVKKAIELDEK